MTFARVSCPLAKALNGGFVDQGILSIFSSGKCTQSVGCLLRRRRCLLWFRKWSLTSVQVINALGLGDVSKSAVEVAHAIEDDAAVDIGIREARIEINRQIEVGEREVDVTIAIRQDAQLSIFSGIVHPEVASRWNIAGCRSAVCILHGRSGVWRCRLFCGLGMLWLVRGADIVTLVARASPADCIG